MQQHDKHICKVIVKTPIQTMNTVLYFKMIFLVNFISYGRIELVMSERNTRGETPNLKVVAQSRRVISKAEGSFKKNN
jgi:hypothetical protein